MRPARAAGSRESADQHPPQRAGEWLYESPTELRAIADREWIAVSDERWQIHLPATLPRTMTATPELRSLVGARLLLTTSRDQEFITAQLQLANQVIIDLGANAHHAVLLELARVALEDRRASPWLEPDEIGWIQRAELVRRLGLGNVEHLNVMICRLRQQLIGRAIENATSIVQSRPRTGNLRLAVLDVEIRGAGAPRNAR
ncbi:MAG: hypothetical protein HC927_01415 [Deltaproteobacteria bacterium]|nr:hypothetical protein [Deltaproteobacteria bacterium]